MFPRLKRGSILLLPLALVLVAAIACGGDEEVTPTTAAATATSPPATSPPATVAPEPVPTEPVMEAAPEVTRLVIAMGEMGEHTNLSWARTTGFDKTHIFEHLRGPDLETGDPMPQLAATWEMRPDGMAYTFGLQKGVQFHHEWGDFTAQDVEHSFRMTMQEGSISDESQLFRDSVKEFVTHDDYSITVELSEPDLFWIPYFGSGLHGSFVINSKAFWDAEGEEGYSKRIVGTGPYQYVSRDLGVSLLTERVEDHWRKTGGFEELEMFFIKEDATRLANLLAGTAHMAVLPVDLMQTAKEDGMKVASSRLPSNAVAWFFGGQYYGADTKDLLEQELDHPWVGKTPDDPNPRKVRQAINKAINREEILSEIFLGEGDLQHTWGMFPTLPGYNPKWDEEWDELYGYDPERARELLAEAGHADGFEIGIVLFPSGAWPEMFQVGEALQLYLEDIGLRPKLLQWEQSEWFQAQRQRGFGGTLFFIGANYRDPIVTLRLYNDSKRSLGHVYETDTIHEMFSELLLAVDPSERERLRREIGDEKYYNFGEIPFIYRPAQIMYNPDVVAEYSFPGSPREFFSHFEYIEKAK